MNKYYKLFAIGLFVYLLIGLFALSKARAQTTLPLSVAPSRQEIIVDPGETTAVNVKFFNRGKTPVSGLLKAVDFIVEDKEGTPIFLEETPIVTGTSQISSRFSAASWATLPYDRITIAPKDKVSIQTKIAVPDNARPGGRYLAVYFEPSGSLPEATGKPREATSPVAVRIAGLVYLRVSGPITEEAHLVQFTAPQFSEYGPTPITTEIVNRGDYHVRPKGIITLTDIFGRTLDEKKLEEKNIFPDASRVFKNELGTKWMFGKYKAELAASYGETGQVLTGTVFFWVFPWKVVSTTGLAIIIVILLAFLFYRHLKKRQEELEKRLVEEKREVEELKKKLEKKDE